MISQFIVALALAVSPVEAPKAAPAPVAVSAPAVANKAAPAPAVVNPIVAAQPSKRKPAPACKPCDCTKPAVK
jgi:hypothetical protein